MSHDVLILALYYGCFYTESEKDSGIIVIYFVVKNEFCKYLIFINSTLRTTVLFMLHKSDN